MKQHFLYFHFLPLEFKIDQIIVHLFFLVPAFFHKSLCALEIDKVHLDLYVSIQIDDALVLLAGGRYSGI